MSGQVDNLTETPTAELDQRGIFIQTLQDLGCSPKESAETIADLFFAGDINSPKWLKHVLTRDAVGFLTPDAQRLLFSFWCHTRRLRFEDEDLPGLFADDEETNETCEIPKPSSAGPIFDLGLGWRTGKDKNGDWIPLPGGPVTYEEALEYANVRAFISSYGKRH